MDPWTRLPCALWLPPACGPALGCRASCQSSPLWTPCQGPPPRSHLPGPRCPGCSVLPASWRRLGGPRSGGWSRPRALRSRLPVFAHSVLCKWESQHVCCVNTSWNPVIETAEGVRPQPPAARAPGGLVPPWAFGVGWQVGSSPPMTQPLTHRTARPMLGRGLEPARTAPGREEGSGRASTASRWHGFRNFLAEAAVKPLKAKFLAPPTPRAKSL